MIVLAIDTATPGLSVALLADRGVIGSWSQDAGRRHTETLAPAIEELCRDTRVALAEVDAIAVDVGPGLFTGLRVGLATAAALAHALARPALGVTSTEILAEPYRSARREVVTAVDVRRGEVAWAHYRGGGEVDGPPQLATPEDLRERLIEIGGAAPGPVAVVGDGALRYREQITAGAEGVEVDIAAPYPSAEQLALIAHRRFAEGEPASPVVPVYLRSADVRIGWASHDLPAGLTTHGGASGGQASGGRASRGPV